MLCRLSISLNVCFCVLVVAVASAESLFCTLFDIPTTLMRGGTSLRWVGSQVIIEAKGNPVLSNSYLYGNVCRSNQNLALKTYYYTLFIRNNLLYVLNSRKVLIWVCFPISVDVDAGTAGGFWWGKKRQRVLITWLT